MMLGTLSVVTSTVAMVAPVAVTVIDRRRTIVARRIHHRRRRVPSTRVEINVHAYVGESGRACRKRQGDDPE
jgi:hypothetical protein